MASYQKYCIIMALSIVVMFIARTETTTMIKTLDIPELLKEVIFGDEKPSMTLKSTAFANLQSIPADYTPDGNDASPALAWTISNSDLLKKTKSFVLVCIDPDAPKMHRRDNKDKQGFIHWILFNIPSSYQNLPKGVPQVGDWENNMKQGKNDFSSDNIGYKGPQPPVGSGVHHYYFVLMALDTLLELGNSTTIEQLLDAIKKQAHVLDYATLIGVYSKN